LRAIGGQYALTNFCVEFIVTRLVSIDCGTPRSKLKACEKKTTNRESSKVCLHLGRGIVNTSTGRSATNAIYRPKEKEGRGEEFRFGVFCQVVVLLTRGPRHNPRPRVSIEPSDERIRSFTLSKRGLVGRNPHFTIICCYPIQMYFSRGVLVGTLLLGITTTHTKRLESIDRQ